MLACLGRWAPVVYSCALWSRLRVCVCVWEWHRARTRYATVRNPKTAAAGSSTTSSAAKKGQEAAEEVDALLGAATSRKDRKNLREKKRRLDVRRRASTTRKGGPVSHRSVVAVALVCCCCYCFHGGLQINTSLARLGELLDVNSGRNKLDKVSVLQTAIATIKVRGQWAWTCSWRDTHDWLHHIHPPTAPTSQQRRAAPPVSKRLSRWLRCRDTTSTARSPAAPRSWCKRL